MRITLAQFHVGPDIHENAEAMLAVLARARRDDWIVFPEGALSGYFPEDDGYLRAIDTASLDRLANGIGDATRRAGCHTIFGTARRAGGAWYNSVVITSATGATLVYDKIGLSRLDVRHFTPGHELPVFDVGGVCIGVQVCRELILPGPWMQLKAQGAQVIFHVNNAVKPHDRAWESILRARAIENGLFVCSVNNAAPPQTLASYLIDPAGRTRVETRPQRDEAPHAEIDLVDVIASLADRQDF